MAEQATTTYDALSAIEAQREYVKRTGSPNFAPADGRCYDCRRSIYRRIEHAGGWEGKPYATGHTVEEAATELITGCPHCNYSFCE
ncbi:MAG: hypothetical protein Q8R92_01700 [Deltaproteobacteria bacterium]|nr:hypothetical protein [Deltaproteobacteria bacterium]